MKTSIDVLVALIAVKDLEIKTLRERVAYLDNECNELSLLVGQQTELLNKSHPIGFTPPSGKN